MSLRPLSSLSRALRGIRRPRRASALAEELEYWRSWLATRGGEKWARDFRERLDPDRPIQGHVAAFVSRLESDPVRILDVGSGPLTKLGKKHPTKRIVITPTDVLANECEIERGAKRT